MAYPNYPYPQYNPYQPQMQAQQMATSQIIWVQGEAGAKSYLVAPGNTVQLWDSEQQTIYLKSADASGMPSIKILDYTVRETNRVPVPQVMSTDYATKADIESLKGQIEAIKARMQEAAHE